MRTQRKNGDRRRKMRAERGGNVSLEVVIPRLNFAVCMGVSHLKRGGWESMCKGPVARESPMCPVN